MLGIDAGSLAIGRPADVVIIDPNANWTVEPNAFYSRNRNTPLLNQSLKGRARQVWVDGKLKYQL